MPPRWSKPGRSGSHVGSEGGAEAVAEPGGGREARGGSRRGAQGRRRGDAEAGRRNGGAHGGIPDPLRTRGRGRRGEVRAGARTEVVLVERRVRCEHSPGGAGRRGRGRRLGRVQGWVQADGPAEPSQPAGTPAGPELTAVDEEAWRVGDMSTCLLVESGTLLIRTVAGRPAEVGAVVVGAAPRVSSCG